jgi:hypothetical protein
MASPERDDQRPPDVAALEAELEGARVRVAASMSTLGDEIARRTDWRAFVREHPLLALGLALGGGYAIGGGLAAPATARFLRGAARLGVQLALVPALEREIAALAARGLESLRGGEADREGVGS